MKTAVLALAALGLVATSATAANRVSDVEYLKANRCKGLAAGLTGVVDASQIDAFLKDSRSTRAAYIEDRASEEFARAKRETRSEDRRARLTAELTGPCSAYLGEASNVAKK